MYNFHYLHPEGMWGVFDPAGNFVAIFMTPKEAAEYCERHNRKEWEADEILKREG